MNCPKCGVPVEPGAQFCPKCFERIESPGLWRRFLALFQSSPPSASRPLRPIINIQKAVSIKTTDEDGRRHDYHSLDELPPELRAEVEKFQAEALKEPGESMVVETSEGLTSKIFSRKTVSVIKVRDAAGNERVYHSIDELPPELRAAYEAAQKKLE